MEVCKKPWTAGQGGARPALFLLYAQKAMSLSHGHIRKRKWVENVC